MSEKKLTIVAKITAKTGQAAAVKAELLKLIPPTIAEKGCIDYILHQDNENENVFLFHENWTNRALWQAHMQSAHVEACGKATEAIVEEVALYEMTPIG